MLSSFLNELRSHWTSKLMSAALNTLVLISILYLTAEAMAASKQPQQPLRPYLTSMMKSATSNTLVSMCILPVASILMAFEAGVASKSGLIMASEATTRVY